MRRNYNNASLTNVFQILTLCMQFTAGKTEHTLVDISKRYLKKRLQMDCEDNRHLIEFIITDKNLGQVGQWHCRTNTQLGDGSELDLKICSIASKESDTASKDSIHFTNFEQLKSHLCSCRKVTELPSVIIMCNHSTRVRELIRFIKWAKSSTETNDSINPCPHIPSMKLSLSISIDEAHKFVSQTKPLVNACLKLAENNNPLLTQFLFISATFTNEDGKSRFWKTLSDIGLHELGNLLKTLRTSSDLETLSANYHSILDNVWHVSDTTEETENFIKSVESTIREQCSRRKIIFAPARYLTSSHDDVTTYFNENGYTVLLFNGKFKGFCYPDGTRIPFTIYRQIHNIKNNEEDYNVFKHYAQSNQLQNIAITGFECISTGLTLQTNGFQFTHAILSNDILADKDAAIQIVGRNAGNKSFVSPVTIISTQRVKQTCEEYMKTMNNILSINPSVIHREDMHTNQSRTIPVKFTLTDDIHSKLLELRPAQMKGGRLPRDAILSLLRCAVNSGECTIEDNNNIYKFNIHDNYRLKCIRCAYNGCKIHTFRLGNHYQNFLTHKGEGQKNDPMEFSIDMSEETMDGFKMSRSNETYRNDKNVLWITFNATPNDQVDE